MKLGRLRNALSINIKVTKEGIKDASCESSRNYFRGMLDAYNDVLKYLDLEDILEKERSRGIECQQDVE